MADERAGVYAGVDTHQDVHVAAVIDATGRLLGTKSFPTTPIGLRALLRWVHRHGPVTRVGVEGTGTYGMGLLRVLREAGIEVVEVNRPNRQLRRNRGKSDPVDAEAAARAVLSGQATAVPKSRDGVVESIRILRMTLESSRRHQARVAAQMHHLILTAPEELRVELGRLTPQRRAERSSRLRPGDDPADLTTATKTALRTLARQYLALGEDLAALRTQLDNLTEQANPGLRGVHGVGPDTAAVLLAVAGDNPQRLTSDAAFAALCGASPVAASSGKTTGHRLNRGGNRAANAALHRIVVVRMGSHQPTKDYIARRTAQGKSKRAIMRCLKRYVAREIYRHLTNPQPAVQITDLRARRTAMALPLRTVAAAVGTHIMTMSRLERGLIHDTELANRYRTWLNQAENAA